MAPALWPVIAAPAVAALLLVFVPEHRLRLVRGVALAGALLACADALWVALAYDTVRGGAQLAESLPLVPSLGISLSLAADGWSVALLVLTGVIIVTGVAASFSIEVRAKEYFISLLLLVAGVFGVFVAQDLFVFFLFYEIAVLPMYLLIGIWGSSHTVPGEGPFRRVFARFAVGDRAYAAMKLTIMLLAGSAFILVAILAMYVHAGASSFDMGLLGSVDYPRQLQLWLFPLLWLGFGTLAGVFPFHTWSPDGHASAPTAVSMLHAGVLMKLGAFGVMRVGMVMLPEGALAWAPVVGAVAVVNIVWGAMAAMSQKDLKYIIAYSSVSHMGVVMLGAAAMNPTAWNGAVYQMVAHGLMTGLFFALVGIVYERAHTRTIAAMGGFALTMPAVAAFFSLACLSSLGLPGTAGFVAELLVFIGAWKSAHGWWAVPAVLGAFVTAVYVLRVVRGVFWGALPAGAHAEELRDLRGHEWVAPCVLAAAVVLLGFYPRLVLDFIDPTSTAYVRALLPDVVAMP